MLSAAARQVLNLLAARNARRDNLSARRLRRHGRRQALLAQSNGNIVVLLLEPEGTRRWPHD